MLAAGPAPSPCTWTGCRSAPPHRRAGATVAAQAYVGAGQWAGGPAPPARSATSRAQIAEVAFYRRQLTDAQAVGQYEARDKSAGAGQTGDRHRPAAEPTKYIYDAATGRKVAEADALGNQTQYGYDTGGFLRTVTDPNGNVTTTEHDVRGNTVSQPPARTRPEQVLDRVLHLLSRRHHQDLTPDPRNDVMLTMRDGRSASATDNTYLTTYAYDAKGNRTTVTDPLGRVTTTTFTDGTTVAAADGGYAPAGLPATVTTPGGATRRSPTAQRRRRQGDRPGRESHHLHLRRPRPGHDQHRDHRQLPGWADHVHDYDGLGRVASQTAPAVTNRVTGAVHTAVTTTYNDDGQVLSQTITDTTGGDAPRTGRRPTTAGQQATTTDAAGETTIRVRRLRPGRQGDDPDGRRSQPYDAEGSLLTTTGQLHRRPEQPQRGDRPDGHVGLRPGRPAGLDHRRHGLADPLHVHRQQPDRGE